MLFRSIVNFRPDQIGQGLGKRHARPCRRIDQHLDRLLANGRGNAKKLKMALRDHGTVGHSQLQWAAVLLLNHQPAHRVVDLVGEKALGPDRQEPQDPLQRLFGREFRRQHQGSWRLQPRLVGVGLLRQMPQQPVQLEVDWRGIVLAVAQ